jgi:hypothetical protein
MAVIRKLVMAQLQGIVLEADPKDPVNFRLNTISASSSLGNEIWLLVLSLKQLWRMVEHQELHRWVEQYDATEMNDGAFYCVELL